MGLLRTVNMHEARAGKPVVEVIGADAPDSGRSSRVGFLAGQIVVLGGFVEDG